MRRAIALAAVCVPLVWLAWYITARQAAIDAGLDPLDPWEDDLTEPWFA